MTIEWTDLIPKDDLDVLLNPPSYITDIEDGSIEDQNIQSPIDDRYQQALHSTRVIPEVDWLPFKIPGFIVPLEFDDQQNITQFFLVPYFGACLHMPPPPPNQMIFVTYPNGIKQENLYDPVWISGFLTTTLVKNETGIAAYSMQMHAFEAYKD